MKKRIAFLITSLRCGGAERITALLAGGLLRRNFDTGIITLAGPEKPFHEPPPGVPVLPLAVHPENCSPALRLTGTPCRVRAIRRAMHQSAPDVLVGMMTECNVLSVLAARVTERMPVKLVLSERVHPAMTNLGTLARAARILTFPLADRVVTCSLAMAGWYRRWLPAQKIVPIQNPVVLHNRRPDPEAQNLALKLKGENLIMAMGRLVPQKGFDLLLKAFALICNTGTAAGWKLVIIGEGGMRETLERGARELGVEGRVLLPGRFRNPLPIVRAGNVFVMSSRYEGFPNALAEAMACGLPAVAFDCPSGPREIIRDKVDGLLVPPGNIAALAGAIESLISNEEMRLRMAADAPDVLKRFALDAILDRWEAVLA